MASLGGKEGMGDLAYDSSTGGGGLIIRCSLHTSEVHMNALCQELISV